MHRGLEKLPLLKELRDVLTALSQMPVGDERIPETIEFIVSRIIAEMKKEGLTSGEDNYLGASYREYPEGYTSTRIESGNLPSAGSLPCQEILFNNPLAIALAIS